MKETILKDRLTAALKEKASDITTFEWKGRKYIDADKNVIQETKLLVDMDIIELSRCYEHCKTMLYNKNHQTPGRHEVLKIIADQQDRCGVELFLRFVEQERNIGRFTMCGNIKGFLDDNKKVFEGQEPVISQMFDNLPDGFDNLKLSLLMDGCLDQLGTLNKKHLTRTFILKQGIWLTPEESKKLIEGSGKKGIDIVKELFSVKPSERLYVNSRGLSYEKMRAMLQLRPKRKFSNLTTLQLETLRNRILFNLESDIKKHIKAWETRMNQITQVMDAQGFTDDSSNN